MKDVSIRRLEPRTCVSSGLWTRIAALRAELLLPEGLTLDDYAEVDARSVHFVAIEQRAGVTEEIAGYVQYDPELNRLRQMIVAQSHRGHSVGEALVEAVKSEARARRQQQLFVHAWTRSLAFYQSVGFRPCGEPRAGATVPWQPMMTVLEGPDESDDL